MPSSPRETPALAPYLVVADGAQAIAFYEAVFGAREHYRLAEPSGKIGHAELELGRYTFMLADEYPEAGAFSPKTVGGTPVTLHLYVEDVDATVDRAVAAGATLVRPVENEFFGDRTAMLLDPFGHRWHVATRKEEVPPEEMQRRWNEMLSSG